ncbi:MAG: hypothetical protein WEA09_09810 [Gemmatimonadota bacterium]
MAVHVGPGLGMAGSWTLFAALMACGETDFRSNPPDAYLAHVEERLFSAETTHVEFRIQSEGAFQADLQGELSIQADGQVSLAANGTFGGEPVDLYLESADSTFTGGHEGGGGPMFDRVPPPALKEALVLGMTRMGLLHNLARLVSGAPPDRADGGVDGWVRAVDPAWTEGGLTFQIVVAGQPSGEATLHFDTEGELVGREQIVRFPGGEMQVREEYRYRP